MEIAVHAAFTDWLCQKVLMFTCIQTFMTQFSLNLVKDIIKLYILILGVNLILI